MKSWVRQFSLSLEKKKSELKILPISIRSPKLKKPSKENKNKIKQSQLKKFRRIKENSSIIDKFFKGNYIFITNYISRCKSERVYHYYSEDDELDDHFDINEYSVVEKLNFIDLNEVKLKEQFLRADLKRRGSAYLIFLASEIVHRKIFNLSLEGLNKNEKKIFVPKEKRQNILEMKIKNDLAKLNFDINNQINNVYSYYTSRIKLKEMFYFDMEFWDILKNIDDTKLQGNNLLKYVEILKKTLCQRLDIWEKVVKCLDISLMQMANKHIIYKPMKIYTFFEIIANIYDAIEMSRGINIPCHLVGKLLESHKNLIVNLIKDCKDFLYFEILAFYKLFVGKGDFHLETAVNCKLELLGQEMDFLKLINVLKIYAIYYDDSDHNEFSILENLLISQTIIQKKEEEKKINYAKKRLMGHGTAEMAMINETILTYKQFETELNVLRSKPNYKLDFAMIDKWIPFKFINNFIQNIIELDYVKNIELIVDFSQLFSKFSYYDHDHYTKLNNSLHSISFSDMRFPIMFDIFIMSITTPKIDKLFLDSSYENIVNYLSPHLQPDTPSNFKKPLSEEEIDKIYKKLLDYYNNVLTLKKNSYFKANSSLFENIGSMVFHLQEINTQKSQTQINHL